MFKVLILVDGSENSDRAVSHVIGLVPLLKDDLEIHLLNVQPTVPGNVRRHISQEELNKYHHDEAIVALASARKLLDAAGIGYTYHIGVGDVSDIAVQYVRDKQLRQIVMGARGLGSVARLLLGSVATRLIHSSEVPVLLVK